MNDMSQKAKQANSDMDSYDPATVDYATKAVTLYRILIPKLMSNEVPQLCAGQRV